MTPSVLDQILVVDRERRRASKNGGFVVPAIHERAADTDGGPFLVSNMRGGFVPTFRRKEGVVWAGFFECPVSEEGKATRALYDTLWMHSEGQGWVNRCSSLPLAVEAMQMQGLDPSSMIVSPDFLREACGRDLTSAEITQLMLTQGYVAESSGIRIYPCDQLSEGTAILAAAPLLVGAYVRVDEHLSLVIQRANRSVVLVGPDDVA